VVGKAIIPWAGCDCWAGSVDMFTVFAVQDTLDMFATNSTMIEIFIWFEPLKFVGFKPQCSCWWLGFFLF